MICPSELGSSTGGKPGANVFVIVGVFRLRTFLGEIWRGGEIVNAH